MFCIRSTIGTVEDGVVTWPGNLDLAPEAMYDAIRAHGRWTVS